MNTEASDGASRFVNVSTAQWVRATRKYWSECASARDFERLMRVRLSQTKIGRWTAPEPLCVDLNLRTLGPSVRIRSHTTDISVLSELLVCESMAAPPDIPDARVVVDLGANIGLAYRWLRNRYPSARFVCVEPELGNLAVLRANANGCEIVAACIGARERQVALVSTGGEWGYRMQDSLEGDTPVMTMERLLYETDIDQIDVLKCDIEGAEAELFANCSGWIGRVRSMIVECHVDALTCDGLIRMLHDNGSDLVLTHLRRQEGSEVATLER